ncbi:LTA synthase family protein [Kordiimonas pumila]|uniref:LTA synthase family protein n=1 Tax=Kordiimonas pumila TaxID=2161677 RepID=A0ABV7D4E3_9PROT|nr:LTA synthase family protein [Kordiimonas pumila]
MSITLVTAVFILPFMAEWFTASLHTESQQRRAAFYILCPLVGVLVYGTCVIVTGREFLGFAGALLYYGGLTAVSNKKLEILREPFNAHDFDNLRNLYIYPEFYVSYVGWPLLILVISVFTSLVGVAFWLEAPLAVYNQIPWAIVLIFWFVGLYLLRLAFKRFINETTMKDYGLSLHVGTDARAFGLFPTIYLYRLLLGGSAEKPALRNRPLHITKVTEKPADIIAIQGESYFDIERLFSKLPEGKSTSWKPLRALEEKGVLTGQITVPAWGAYTMQTEFSFLSGIENSLLGIDHINPYMRFAQTPVATYVRALKAAGYRTICIHPAKKEFFRRSDVMPNLGFDDFIGLEAFEGAPYYGKYIADDALADEIEHIIQGHHAMHTEPLFIFAITIESHGPWAEGRLAAHVDEEKLTAANPMGDPAFALYQNHMENLLALYRRLSVDAGKTALRTSRTVALYGDHMPAHGALFEKYGFDETPVDYLLWSNTAQSEIPETMRSETFFETILHTAGLKLL